MGVNDRERFRAFAHFLHRTFPDARRVADVGGGRGTLSYHLRTRGHESTIVDLREPSHPRWVRRCLRKESREAGRVIRIPTLVAPVEEVDLGAFDLVVGLHPDEATEPIVRAAVAQGTDFAVVPCCVFPLDGVKRSQEEWLEHLAGLAPGSRTATLPIRGANVVLYRHRPGPEER